MLDLSIIIVGYKTRGLLKNCLNSIFDDLANSNLNYKIIVVDNNSRDGTKELLEEHYSQIEAIILQKNLGYAKAVNIGINAQKAKYYFILNPDTLFLQESIMDRLYSFMEEHSQVGLAGPKLINPDKTIQLCCCQFPSFLIPIYRRTFLGKLPWAKNKIRKFLMSDWNHQETRPVDWVIGTSMFIRDKALQEVGLMDERFFMYFEDIDWCRRFWKAGWQIYYLADIKVIHYHGRLSLKSGGLRDLLFNKITHIHIKSWLKYFWKYL